MSTEPYIPQPIPVAQSELPAQINELTERLAENTHDLWALERQAQGWTYGPERNDSTKQHPCLVAYARLPESEKTYDRNTALGTLKAIMALGYKIEPTSSLLAPTHLEAVNAWTTLLEQESAKAQAKGSRAWTFDVDDGPELEKMSDEHLPLAKQAMSILQAVVYPVWEKENAAAIIKQAWHKKIAALAIWPGILAIAFAILQLAARHLAPAHSAVAETLSYLELVSVIIAAIAVIVGFSAHLHDGWLAHRQRAERLRILKFKSLSWPELWCDIEEWKLKLQTEVNELVSLTTHAVHLWAKQKDIVRPDLPQPPNCVVPQADLQALATLYRIKRLQFQRHYFHFQAGKASGRSWIVDNKIGLWLFALSVVIVSVHGGHHIWHFLTHPHETPSSTELTNSRSTFDIVSITLAALLPIIGFGFRAWLAAFEAPRSRNLYQAKELALEEYIARSSTSVNNVEKTLHHISHAEHFFINEHREWCRLQMETEWFV